MALPRSLSLALGVALLVAALAFNVSLGLRSVDTLARGFDNESRPAEVQRTLMEVMLAVQSAETGQRGYLLTGDAQYLESFRTSETEVQRLLVRLDSLVSWNPVQVERMPGLRQSVGAKFDEMGESIRLFEAQGGGAALDFVQTNAGLALMRDIRRRIEEMLTEARRVRAFFAERALAAEGRARTSVWISAGALALLLALIGAGLRTVDRRRTRDAARLRDANGALSEALGEREAALGRVRAMQGQLVQQEKLAGMGRLTAGVAHELKNPLNFVLNFASLTEEMAAEAAEAMAHGDAEAAADALAAVRQNAGKIREHGERADGIVRSMLIHARGVTGERAPADLGEVARAAVDQALGPNPPAGVEATVEVEPGLPPVPMVVASVSRALRNLAENALYAVRERGQSGDADYRPRVRVTVARGTDRADGHATAVVTVADNGTGIPDDVLPRIFEPFVTTKGPGAGTGLGLSLAHDIAVGHGGTLLAERTPGGGATFRLALPLAAPELEAS